MRPDRDSIDPGRRTILWGVLLLVSVGLHLWGLDSRSYHHDESLHARLSWNLVEHGAYRYDPTYHGPVLYLATAVVYQVLGDSDFTARLPAALAGIALLWVCWNLRRHLGEWPAWWSGVLVTVSPTMLYFGRFARMDIPELLWASAAVVSWLDALQGRPRAWIWLGCWSGLALATKENVYVTAALLAATGVFVGLDEGPTRAVRAVRAWATENWRGVLLAGGVAAVLSTTLHTVGWTRPEDALFPLKAVRYWWEQHEIQRVAGPWWFHLPRLVQYEFLILGAGLAWVVRGLRGLGRLEFSLMVFGLASVAMYAYLGEKVPWLVVHQSWAFIPLAGLQAAAAFSRQGTWLARTLVSAGLGATIVASLTLSFVLDEISPARQRVESVHFVQTTPEFAYLARGVTSDAGWTGGVFVAGDSVWPLNWYWRHAGVLWRLPTGGDRPALVVCNPEDVATVRAAIGDGYRERAVPLRSWWLMAARPGSVSDWVRYLFTRKYWGSIGSTMCVVFARSDIAMELDPPPGHGGGEAQ